MYALAKGRGLWPRYMLRVLRTQPALACRIAASPMLGMRNVACTTGKRLNILSRDCGTARVHTGNGFCLQLCCEQSRVLLRFPELRVLMRKEADSASACKPIRAALQHKRALAQ